MTDKEAIEGIKGLLKQTQIANDCGLSNNDFAIEIEIYKTILNLIQTQQAEIENKEKEKQIHIKLEQQYKKEYLDTKEKLEKKDKIIDEMIAFITKHYKEDEEIEKFAKEVMERGEWTNLSKILREYFERKLEENN